MKSIFLVSPISIIIAMRPATAGVDMLEPDFWTYSSLALFTSEPGMIPVDSACLAELMFDPGATTHGFISS